MIDLTTYALLRKQIATAASGISDVRVEGNELVFVLVDGHEVRMAIPATEIRDAVVRDDVLVLTLEDNKEIVVDTTLTQSGQAADAKVTGDALACKLTEPSTGLAVGKYFRIAAIDESGHAVLEAVDAAQVGVQDVQVAGASVVTDGVANVPIANEFGKTGVVKLSNAGGIKWSNSIDALALDYASQADIVSRSSTNKSIIPYYLDYAVRAAMCDGKGAAWTSEEQAAARERMAVENGADFELLVDATLEEEANTFQVVIPRPLRECMYQIWFFNNNKEQVTVQTYCFGSSSASGYLLRNAKVNSGYGYALNGFIRYNGQIKGRSLVGYASDSMAPSWTSYNPGNGNTCYMSYPSDIVINDIGIITIRLLNTGCVLNAGAVIKVWGR